MNQGLRDAFMETAFEDLREFNRNKALAASDFLLGREIAPYTPFAEGEAIKGIVLVDGLWGTQLWRFGKDDALRTMCDAYETHRGCYALQFAALHSVSLADQPEEVNAIAAALLRTLLETRLRKQHYSFATKLFHWHAREHLPIMDSNARAAIGKLEGRCSGRQRIVRPDGPAAGINGKLSDYRDWILLYSELIQSLTPKDQKDLLTADRESLPPAFSMGNSLLRVIDKVFYIWGQ